MKTPIEFDYDLWTTEDGKCMVRVKQTGEVTEVDRDVMKILRREEKQLRRSMTGAPIEGSENGEESTILSLDYVSTDGGDEMEAAWLVDRYDSIKEAELKFVERDFRKTLTDKQRSVYVNCLLLGMSYKDFADETGVSYQSVQQSVALIQKKAKKFF